METKDPPIRVLLVDDDEGMFVLISHMLHHSSKTFEVRAVPSAAGRVALGESNHDVCLVGDTSTSTSDHIGFELLTYADTIGFAAPIIILSETADEELDLQAMSLGASDCIAKGQLNARLLERSIRYGIERNRIHAALRSSEERARRVLNAAPVLLFELDRDGIVTFAEGSALRVLRIRTEDLIGRSAFEIYPEMEAETRRALSGRAVTRTVELNGVVLQTHVSPTRDAAGRITGATGVATDITRRARFERDLRANKRELQAERDFITAILDTMSSLAVVVDREGRFVRFNRACEKLTRYRVQEVQGRHYWDFVVPPEEVEEVKAQFVLRREGPFPNVRENHWITRSGERRYISWANSAIYDASGSVAYIVAAGIDITERKEVEDALRYSQHLFQTFMDLSSSVTFIKDRNLRYVFVNKMFTELVGRPASEIIGLRDRDLFPEPLADLWEEADRMVMTSSGTITRVDKVSGDRHFLTTKFTVPDVSGQVLIGGQSIEITERVQAELSLRRSEERFQLAARATNDAIWDWDIASNTLSWHANVHHLFKYDPELVTVTMDWWKERLHPDDHDGVTQSLRAAVENNVQFWTAEYRFQCSDGSYAFVRDSAYLMRDVSGKPVHMIGAMTDLTERKKVEDALRESEERYRRIVETAQEGIIMIDGEGRIRFANARMSEMLGYSLEEMRNRHFTVFAESGHGLPMEILRGHAAGLPQRHDMKLIRTDGTVMWAVISANPLVERDGSPGGTLAMVSDITDRKEAERALQEINDRLEVRVAERTAEIVDMMARLEQAHQIQQRFVADASHDLRTPLTVVRAELDLLLQREVHDLSTRQSLLRIANESRRLENMASDLLLLATIDSQRTLTATELIQLDDLLFDCVAQLQTLAADKGISWNIDVQEPVSVRCNGMMLHRAVTNVLENAIKYSGRSSIVEVRLTYQDCTATVEVSDNGVGISQSDLPHVFDRFYRGDLSRQTTGSGLGLSIVKAVIDGHGGAIGIESESGKGTTISMEIPMASLAAPAPVSVE
ncbi:MAG: PAS domain S-box protein [Bacteroidetes bacterium]|nr:PAS domain S-box protein [Bacteroidota bacterium]